MVAGLELVTSTGELVRATRGAPDFDGLVVGLGALGAVTRVTLDVEPAYLVRQRVFERLGWAALFENFEAITSSGYSVSLFTRWREGIDQIWIKSRVGDAPERIRGELFGAPATSTEHHPIPGLDPVNCSAQLGRPGPPSERLPHFRSGFTPSNGEEIQSEYIVARDDAIAAIQALRALSDTIAPVLQVSEIRTVAADGLWMSPEYGRDSVAIHFTWRREPRAVKQALSVIEAGLIPLGARPHWGKLFLARAGTLASSYERLSEFAQLAERLDSRGAFRNAWLEKHVLAPR
jgi:alditol oxidase